MNEELLRLDPALIAVLSGSVIPMLLALVAKRNAPVWFKALCNLVLSAGAGALAVFTQNPDGIEYKRLIVATVLSLFTSEVAYNVVWKPLGVFPKVEEAVPSGIGPSVAAVEPESAEEHSKYSAVLQVEAQPSEFE